MLKEKFKKKELWLGALLIIALTFLFEYIFNLYWNLSLPINSIMAVALVYWCSDGYSRYIYYKNKR